MNLPEGKLTLVYRGGSHDVFHASLPLLAGDEHQCHHLKYRYDTRKFFDQEPCWHSKSNPCPAVVRIEEA